jgi:hypothetical protein
VAARLFLIVQYTAVMSASPVDSPLPTGRPRPLSAPQRGGEIGVIFLFFFLFLHPLCAAERVDARVLRAVGVSPICSRQETDLSALASVFHLLQAFFINNSYHAAFFLYQPLVFKIGKRAANGFCSHTRHSCHILAAYLNALRIVLLFLQAQ